MFIALSAILLPFASIGTLLYPQEAVAEDDYFYPAGKYSGHIDIQQSNSEPGWFEEEIISSDFSFFVTDDKKITQGKGHAVLDGTFEPVPDCSTTFHADISFIVRGTINPEDKTATLKFARFSPDTYSSPKITCPNPENPDCAECAITFWIEDANVSYLFTDFYIELKNKATYDDSYAFGGYSLLTHAALDREQKIEVRATDVGGFPGLLGAKHLFIVYTDDDDKPWIWRAGPTKECELKLNLKWDCGNIWSPGELPYSIDSTDWDTSAPSVIVYSGKDASSLVSCFESESTRIDNAHVKYKPTGPNSNSFVHTLLRHCGAAIKKPDVYAPGWKLFI